MLVKEEHMKTKKYEIYMYWSDKAITKDFEIKRINDCTPEDDAVKITELPDEIFCWACHMPPFQTADAKTLRALWNGDRLLDKAHIVPKSKGGDDSPGNLFLLCPNCHADSPDTTNPKIFFAWVRYRIRNENWAKIIEREMKKAANIKGVDYDDLVKRSTELDIDMEKIFELRQKIQERSGLHGTTISWSTKTMNMLDILQEELSNKK